MSHSPVNSFVSIATALCATAILMSAPIANASPTKTSSVNGVSNGQPELRRDNEFNTRADSVRLLDGSQTATFYYKRGVRHFEAGNLDAAEKAFKATLRADGLDSLSLHYLVIINDQQGDQAEATRYTDRYNALISK